MAPGEGAGRVGCGGRTGDEDGTETDGCCVVGFLINAV